MIRNLFLILNLFFSCDVLFSQVLCVTCLKQNNRVSTNVMTNKIQNGSFETSNCVPWSYQGVYCPNSNNFSCTLPNWTCTGGGTNSYPMLITNTTCVIVDGIRAAYLGNGVSASACATSQADTSCLAVSNCTVVPPPNGFPSNTAAFGGTTGVSIEQTISGLTVGSNYALEFWAGGEKQAHVYRGLFAVDVGFGKIFLRCTATGVNDVGERYVVQFKATSTSHTIKFTNWGHIISAATEIVLDDIRLYDQSELSSSVSLCGNITGLANNYPDQIRCSPNPFVTSTEINLPPSYSGGTATIINFTGKVVQSLVIVSDKLVISRNDLPAGLYYLLITDNDGKESVQKLVITDL